MLKVYGDESYNRDRTLFAVSGVLGSDAEWADVISDWTTRTGGKAFHASDCECHRGDFATHDEAAQAGNHALYKDLVKIIAGSRLLCSGAVMDVTAFREAFPGLHDEAPYYKGFVHVLKMCAGWAHLSIPQEQIKVFFDQNPRTNSTAAMLYNQMARTPKWAYASILAREPNHISFPTRADPHIQVADLMARETMKYPKDPIGKNMFPRRLSMEALRRANRADISVYGHDYFQSMKVQWPELERVAALPMSGYVQWLERHKQYDSPYQRFRYLVHVDELEGQ